MSSNQVGAGANASSFKAPQVAEGIEIRYVCDEDGIQYSCTGRDVVEGVKAFEDPVLGFSPRLLQNLLDAKYTTPTTIQKHSMPQLTAGEADLMAISQTGTGKTAAYLLPIINFVAKKEKSDGSLETDGRSRRCSSPTALVLVPTRELAEQVVNMVKLFAKGLQVKGLAVYGGDYMSKELSELKGDVQVLVACPGRLLHILTEYGNVLNVAHVKYLVIDEADEMFDRGFFHDIGKVIDSLQPKETRKNIMFSATFPLQIQYYAKKFLNRHFSFVVVGTIGSAAPDIFQQIVYIDETEKSSWLYSLIEEYKDDKILVFCNTIEKVDQITTLLQFKKLKADCLHSFHSQQDRNRVLENFKNGAVKYLVATSVASRGLNIDKCRYVVNFDFPKDISEYVQRIGRARVTDGKPATAYSYFDERQDQQMLNDLIAVLEQAGQQVPGMLTQLQDRIKLENKDFADTYPYADEDLASKMKKFHMPNTLECPPDIPF